MIRRVLVTGSTRGIGLGIARELLDAGFAVTLHGRAESEGCRELLGRYPETATFLRFDVRDRAAAAAALGEALEAGPYWGIVCNAGVSGDGVFAGITGEQWDTVIETNLSGFYNVVHPLLLPLTRLRAGGRILLVSSVAGTVGNRGQVHYSASKAGLIGAARALAQELAPRQITVNVLAPGFIETEMLGAAPREQLVQRVPLGRLGTVAEVAGFARFLFTPEAGYMTGQVLTIAGGIG